MKLVKLDDTFVILPDGGYEKYKPFGQLGIKLTECKGYAVMDDGKVLKADNGQFEIYPKKSTALQVMQYYQNK